MKYIVLCLVFAAVTSCGIFEAKPDKKIDITLRVLDVNELQKAKVALHNRLQKIGVLATIMQSGDDLLSITFETSADTSAVKQYLIERANLEFYEVSSSKVIQKEIDSLKDGIAKIFSFSKFDYIPQIGSALPNDTVAVFKFFKTNLSSNFTSLLGIDYVLKWGVLDREGRMPLYLLKLEDNLKPAMSGNLLISASQGESAFGWITISITMVPSAAKDWELLTGLAYKNASQIAIVLNGVVYSAPGITAGPISGGRSEISGDFSAEEAKEIARKLTMGYLPQLQIVSFQVDSID